MDDIALGVTIFKRIDKLEQLLESVDPEVISHVYIADDGEKNELKETVYNRSYPFGLTVIDLEYDSGLGYGRNEIVKLLDYEYMLLMDCDMEVPCNVTTLRKQLEANPSYGGICGMYIENDRVYTPCSDIYIEGDRLIQTIRDPKQIGFVAGSPLIEFDFIANAALFRRECLMEYSWDPEYVIGREHIDFYTGHYLETDWKFGLCPEVFFPHHPGGNQTYMANRFSKQKYEKAENYFLEKWGFDEFVPKKVTWIDTFDPRYGDKPPFSLLTRARVTLRDEGPRSLLSKTTRYIRKQFI